MRHFVIVIALISILLAACSPPAQPVVIPNTGTSAPANPTLAPATMTAPTEATKQEQPGPTAANQPEQATATAAPTAAPASPTVYKIVPGESQVSYEVGETFFNQNNRFNVAIGVTKQVTGEIYGNKTDPTKSSIGVITVDISQLKSDSGQRDNMIRRRFLESTRYPLATFTPTRIENLPSSYVEGQDYSFKVTGDLNVHQVTKEVTFDVTARLTGETLTGTATSAIKLSDFGVGPISLVGILQTQDDAKLKIDFVARPG